MSLTLSVSISAITSPLFNSSPSRFVHFAIFPSVIVGERAGIGNTFPTAWLAEEENVRVLLMVESNFLVEERLGRVCERIGFEQPVMTLLWITLLKRLSLRLC